MAFSDRHCFVPGCKVGYPITKVKNAKLGLKNATLFTAKTQFQVEQWRKVIPRLDRVFQKRNAVCAQHFEDDCIERYYKTLLRDGTYHFLERSRPRLKNNAVPSIFPLRVNCRMTWNRKCLALSKAAQDEPSMTSSTVGSSCGKSDERPTLEDNPLGDVNRVTETASPPQEAFPADKDSGDSCVVDVKPDVDTLLINEAEWADRDRIMKHRYECCRLCLERSEDLIDIFKGTEVGLVIRQAIKDFLHFEVVRKGKSPWQVCYACMQKLSDFQEFKDRCVETKILWDDCSKYIDGDSTAYNTRSSAIQPGQNNESEVMRGGTIRPIKLEPMDEEITGNEIITPPYREETVSRETSVVNVIADKRVQPGLHSKPDVVIGRTACSFQRVRKFGEETGNVINTPTYGDETISRENSVVDAGGQIKNIAGVAMDHDATNNTEDIQSEMRNPCDRLSAEVDGEGCESHLNPMHDHRTRAQPSTQPNWPEDKENSTANQVKGIYELDDCKGSDGEPLVLILRMDGVMELCTLSEIPPNMRSGIQKYSKLTGNLTKKRPRIKGD